MLEVSLSNETNSSALQSAYECKTKKLYVINDSTIDYRLTEGRWTSELYLDITRKMPSTHNTVFYTLDFCFISQLLRHCVLRVHSDTAHC